MTQAACLSSFLFNAWTSKSPTPAIGVPTMPRREVYVSFIELDHVSFSYPGPSVPRSRDISLSIDEGEYLAIIGANGSGKEQLC